MSDRHISQHFETLAIHAGNTADPLTGAVVPPIYQVSTYKQDGVGGLRGGYEYSRSANPTRTALEENLAALEGGRRGLAFASGLAAEDCLLRTLLAPGDHVVIPNDAYGGTFRLFAKVVARWGVEWSVADTSDPAAVRAAITPKTKVIWVETPSNPLLGITDIAAVAQVARDAGARLVVDNTFATPYLQQPLALGADVVVHSLTKYMGGHSDVGGGGRGNPHARGGGGVGVGVFLGGGGSFFYPNQGGPAVFGAVLLLVASRMPVKLHRALAYPIL
ncbi:aminotransferase class I/II-fold pyridoxal phosphate-dependent enzyme, partial [Streptomyces albogriseolus]|uniref:aminotransferase class I/II-fold pyridoxal phosphate-dependent enzyme n=1 Tax=Streptomyces albogriseolus TaxID=1887 RepID=UPI00369896F1